MYYLKDSITDKYVNFDGGFPYLAEVPHKPLTSNNINDIIKEPSKWGIFNMSLVKVKVKDELYNKQHVL